jgi:hypothetical protein
MSDLKKGDEESGHHRIRITLTSRNKDEVEKGMLGYIHCSSLHLPSASR